MYNFEDFDLNVTDDDKVDYANLCAGLWIYYKFADRDYIWKIDKIHKRMALGAEVDISNVAYKFTKDENIHVVDGGAVVQNYTMSNDHGNKKGMAYILKPPTEKDRITHPDGINRCPHCGSTDVYWVMMAEKCKSCGQIGIGG